MNLCDTGLRAVIFDYGGTLDTGGRHWFEVIADAYDKVGLGEIGRDTLYEAYIFAERELAVAGRVTPDMPFHDLMVLKMQIQFGWLAHTSVISWEEAERCVPPVASACLAATRQPLSEAAKVLERLSATTPLAVVSNFYGNLDTVLRHNGLRHYFMSLIDSATVGVRKPDSRIFSMACLALGVAPGEATVIGDSWQNDIIPALEIGCRAIWLTKKNNPSHHDSRVRVIKSLSEL